MDLIRVYLFCFVAEFYGRHTGIAVADVDKMAAVSKTVGMCDFIKSAVGVHKVVER